MANMLWAAVILFSLTLASSSSLASPAEFNAPPVNTMSGRSEFLTASTWFVNGSEPPSELLCFSWDSTTKSCAPYPPPCDCWGPNCLEGYAGPVVMARSACKQVGHGVLARETSFLITAFTPVSDVTHERHYLVEVQASIHEIYTPTHSRVCYIKGTYTHPSASPYTTPLMVSFNLLLGNLSVTPLMMSYAGSLQLYPGTAQSCCSYECTGLPLGTCTGTNPDKLVISASSGFVCRNYTTTNRLVDSD